MNKHVLESVMHDIELEFGEMTTTRGNDHTYVGMEIKFIGNGKVEICMISYLKEAIKAFPGTVNVSASTPATVMLFEVNNKADKLPEEQREIFHSIVAKILFVSTRARPDLHTTISFLTSRCVKVDC